MIFFCNYGHMFRLYHTVLVHRWKNLSSFQKQTSVHQHRTNVNGITASVGVITSANYTLWHLWDAANEHGT